MTLLILNRGTQLRLTTPKWPWVLNKDSLQAQGLVGWWPLGLTPHPLVDMSGFGQHGIYGGSGFSSQLAANEHGSLVQDFNTASNRIRVPVGVQAQSLSDRTVMAWIFPRAVANEIILRGQNGGTFKHKLTIGTNIAPTGDLGYQSGANDVNTTNTPISTNKTFHVGASAQGTTLGGLYVDGVAQPTTGSLSAMTAETDFYIGARSSGADDYNGLMWDVRYYNRVFSEREMYEVFTPETRHDLVYELGRTLYFFPAAAGVVGVGQYPVMVYG